MHLLILLKSNFVVLFRVFVILFPLYLCSQQNPKNLKQTLGAAEEAFQVSFSYDDDFIQNWLSPETPLPKTLDEFLEQLQRDYQIAYQRWEANILLAPLKNVPSTTICGYIKSQLFENGLENTLVVLGKQFVYADASGFFSITTQDTITKNLLFKNINFGSQTLDIAPGADCFEYFVDQNEIKLGEVILNYIAPPIEKSSNGVFTINLEGTNIVPGSVNPDIFQLLQLLPGVSNPNENNTVFVRGGTPDQNIVQWNKIRLYQNNHANGGLSSINPYGLNSIQLMVKGVPAHFGEHTSGLILLENLKFSDQKKMDVSAGLNLLDADLVVQLQTEKKLQLNLSARSSFRNTLSNDFRTNTFNRLIAVENTSGVANPLSNQSIYYNDFTFSTRFPINENHFIATKAFYIEDQIDYELSDTDLEYRDGLQSKNYGFGVSHSFQKNGWNRDFNISFSHFEMDYERLFEQYEFDEEEQTLESEYEDFSKRNNRVAELQFKMLHKKQIHPEHLFLWGGDYTYRTIFFEDDSEVNNSMSNRTEDLTGNAAALFGAIKSNFSERHLWELGLRYNYFNAIALHRLEPRINYSLLLPFQWSINATYEKKSQSIYRTNQTISNISNNSNNLWTGIGNSSFPLLKSSQLSLGMTKSNNKTIFEFDLYRRNLEGITTFSFGYLDPNDRDYHTGVAEIYGADFFFQKKWERLNLWASYSHQENKNSFDDLKNGVWFNSNFLVRDQLNTGFSINLKDWYIHLNYNIRSGIPYSQPSTVILNPQGYELVYDTLNDRFLPNYERLDLSASKKWMLSKGIKLDAKASFLNLTNKKNVLERIHIYDKGTQAIKALDRYSLVPFFNVGLRFYINNDLLR